MKTALNYMIVIAVVVGFALAMKGMVEVNLWYATLSLLIVLVAYLLDRKANPEDYKE